MQINLTVLYLFVNFVAFSYAEPILDQFPSNNSGDLTEIYFFSDGHSIAQTFEANVSGLFHSITFPVWQFGILPQSAQLEVHTWNNQGSTGKLGGTTFTPIVSNSPGSIGDLYQTVNLSSLNIFLTSGQTYGFVLSNSLEYLTSFDKYYLGKSNPDSMAIYAKVLNGVTQYGNTYPGGELWIQNNNIWNTYITNTRGGADIPFATFVDPGIQPTSTPDNVPEPTSLSYLGIGLAFFVAIKNRKKIQNSYFQFKKDW